MESRCQKARETCNLNIGKQVAIYLGLFLPGATKAEATRELSIGKTVAQ